jgi:hypothetical protein
MDAPALLIELRLEETGRITLVADTHEDELRLRAWLRRSPAFERLPAILQGLLDDLDQIDLEAA